ncbi:MAG: Tox-REase-5 domain-containing protein [Steroidobacteraceae bacterium]
MIICMSSEIFPAILTVSRRYSPAQTLSAYQAESRLYLQKITEILPGLGSLKVLGDGGFVEIAENLSNLELVITSVVQMKGVDSDFLPPRTHCAISPYTRSRFGYEVTYYLSKRDSSDKEESDLKITIRGASTDIESGSSVTCTFQKSIGARLSPLTFRILLETSIAIWQASFGSVRSVRMEKKISEPGDFCAGDWLYYFSFEDLGEFLPSRVTCDSLLHGTIIESAPHLLDPDDPADLQRARTVRKALDHLGLVWHSTYAIHGWPPDEEEWRYEEFISGAPRGRKYRLRCIDFDGYDAQRNVLLYAKLFRRLRQQRKEWGLRGWDGPVLNEARRQVRAANGTQIEWHVGLEEPAARVRTLLADYTDFKDEQLRVIYTPLSQAVSR